MVACHLGQMTKIANVFGKHLASCMINGTFDKQFFAFAEALEMVACKSGSRNERDFLEPDFQVRAFFVFFCRDDRLKLAVIVQGQTKKKTI
jgi:hypothetical protein